MLALRRRLRALPPSGRYWKPPVRTGFRAGGPALASGAALDATAALASALGAARGRSRLGMPGLVGSPSCPHSERGGIVRHGGRYVDGSV